MAERPNPERRFRKGLARTAMASILVMGVTGFAPWDALIARAQDAAGFDDETDFHIPAEPLDHALAAYAKTSGVDILYVLGPTADQTSTALNGRYSDAAALQVLLKGTGLLARFTSRKAAIIFTAARTPTPTKNPLPTVQLDMAEVRAPVLLGRSDPNAFRAYAQGAVAQIRSRLRDDPVCRGSSFRIVASLTVTESGRIDAVALVEGSGDAARDLRIRRVLAGLILSKPPAGLTRPLRFEIDWSPLDGGS